MKKILFCLAVLGFSCFNAASVTFNKITTDDFEFNMAEIPRTDFQIGITEVTQKVYRTVMENLPDCSSSGDNLPVTNISFIDAIIFCNRLSDFCGLEPVYSINGDTSLEDLKCKGALKKEETINQIKINPEATGFKLPTEKEWKIAANGGAEDFRDRTSKNFYEWSWVFQNSEKRSHPVAGKKPNNFGIYDMTGNVAEWVYDKADLFSSANRVIKGGHFMEFPVDFLYRNSSFAGNSFDWVGLRIICRKPAPVKEETAEN